MESISNISSSSPQNTGFKGSMEPKVHADYPVQWAKTHTPVDRNARMGSFARNQSSGNTLY